MQTEASPPALLASYQTLVLFPPKHSHHHPGEDLSPRETSVCHNPCCSRGLIGRPTDLRWCSEMRLWSEPQVGCEQTKHDLSLITDGPQLKITR